MCKILLLSECSIDIVTIQSCVIMHLFFSLGWLNKFIVWKDKGHPQLNTVIVVDAYIIGPPHLPPYILCIFVFGSPWVLFQAELEWFQMEWFDVGVPGPPPPSLLTLLAPPPLMLYTRRTHTCLYCCYSSVYIKGGAGMKCMSTTMHYLSLLGD